jgi:hypothetical protein
MRALDCFYATLTLPDGRQCKAQLYGVMHDKPDGFEVAESDPLLVEWMDGTELSDAEYDMTVTWERWSGPLHEWASDALLTYGQFEPWFDDGEDS